MKNLYKSQAAFGRLVSFLGIIAIGAAITFGMTGCKSEDDNPVDKKLTISGINSLDLNGAVVFVMLSSGNNLSFDNSTSAGGTGIIENNAVTIQLKKAAEEGITNENWTGSGNYYIFLGQSMGNDPAYVTSAKIDFSLETTTVRGNQFRRTN
jgi:hypothetical protein